MHRILIAESQRREAANVAMFLQDQGFAVATVHTGRHLVNFSRQYEMDLLLVDLSTPIENAFTSIAEVRCRPHSVQVPIIGLISSPQHDQTARTAGCSAAVTKPLDYQQLLRVIYAHLGTPNVIPTRLPKQMNASHSDNFVSLAELIVADVAALEPSLGSLGDMAPMAHESMREASSTLWTRLEPTKISFETRQPFAVQDRHTRHDFRNLLAAVMGFADILLLEDNVPAEIEARLRRIKQSTRRFCDLLDQIRETAA